MQDKALAVGLRDKCSADEDIMQGYYYGIQSSSLIRFLR